MIDRLVSDLLSTTRRRIEASGVSSVDDVRAFDGPLVALSEEIREGNLVLKSFLRDRLYHHQRIESMKDESRVLLRALFERYMENKALLPQDAQARAEAEGCTRVVADYIAGMTDRFATDEYRRLIS